VSIQIHKGRVLAGSDFDLQPVIIRDRLIETSDTCQADLTLDAAGLMVLPGIVDIYGDAFERQIEPRSGVQFALALAETDRQLVANGITTACHAVTCSWEPGPRSLENAQRLLEALCHHAQTLSAEHRFHLRHEIFNLDAPSLSLDRVASGRLNALAFNDDMDDLTHNISRRSAKLGRMIKRTGLTPADDAARLERVTARRRECPASLARIAEAAGEHVIFGAPNVVRGGSQNMGCPDAGAMVASRLCTILASDYFYPAMPQAVFTLVRNHALTLAEAWNLISAHPADALGLQDRGAIAPGKRADLVLARMSGLGIEVLATIAKGELVYLTDARLISSAASHDVPARRAA